MRFTDPDGMWGDDFLKGWNRAVKQFNNDFYAGLNARIDNPGLLINDAAEAADGLLRLASDITGISDAVTGENQTSAAIMEGVNTLSEIPSMSEEQQGAAVAGVAITVVRTAISKKVPVAKGLKNPGRAGKQARLKELANDPKVGSADRGWIKNEQRHIKTGNRKSIRLPGNSRNSKKRGKELAHPRGQRAKDGHSYKNAKLQDADLHKLEHKHGGY